MPDNFLNDLLRGLEVPKQAPSYIGRKTPTGMFDFYVNSLLSRNEQTSSSVASIAACGLQQPGILTLDEIKAVCGSVLTQAPDRNNLTNPIGMFGRRSMYTTNALFGMNEQTSSYVASIASRGLQAPETLTLAEIKAVCASALTQAPNRN